MEGKGSNTMAIWFMIPRKESSYFRNVCLFHLEHAVRVHLPPNHVYRDENGDPIINYDMPSIKDIGNGVYVKQKMIGQKDGGKLVPDMNANMPFTTLPKKISWDSLQDCHIYYGGANVREFQYNVGQHAKLGRDWHRVYLERMPVWSAEGKQLTPNDTLFKNSFYAGVRMTGDQNSARDTRPSLNSIVRSDFYNGTTDTPHQVLDNEMWYGRVVSQRGKAWLDATGTDFCVLVTMPRKFKATRT